LLTSSREGEDHPHDGGMMSSITHEPDEEVATLETKPLKTKQQQNNQNAAGSKKK
jgi:hypothetical protein